MVTEKWCSSPCVGVFSFLVDHELPKKKHLAVPKKYSANPRECWTKIASFFFFEKRQETGKKHFIIRQLKIVMDKEVLPSLTTI